MSRRIGQFPKLFGYLVSQFGLMQLVGKLFQRSKVRLCPVVLALLASGSLAQAASSLTLKWDPSPETNVVGYVLYYGAIGGSALNVTEVGIQTTATVKNLFGGTTNFFFVVAYDAQAVASVRSEVVVSEVPGIYLPPTVSTVADQVIDANTSTGPISFAVDDAQFPVGQLALSAASSNPDLVPEANILFSGSASNRTVTVTPALGQFGSAIITLRVDDGIQSSATNFRLTVNPITPDALVYLTLQAEVASLLSPMTVSDDRNASEGQFIATTIDSLGAATFTVDIPFASSCVIWCRVLSPDSASESFIVSVDDGREDVYDAALDNGSNLWQWSVVNGRGGTDRPQPAGASPINRRLFPLTVGRHIITFQGHKPNAGLDEILITNDPDYVPTGIISTQALSVPATQTINELDLLVVTNSATQLQNPTNTLTFSLLSAPEGANLDSNTGVLTWTPTEGQGPSINFISVQLTDGGSPTYIDVRRFAVIVNEVNSAPVLSVPGELRIDELATLQVEVTATDPDSPNNRLRFSLLSAPEGMTISTNTSVLVWTPTEAQGPSTNLIWVQVTDDGSPPLSDVRSLTVIVNETNSAPVLARPPDRVIHHLSSFLLTNTVTDLDSPSNAFTFSLLSAPAGMSLDPGSGVLSWTPTEAQRPSTNLITVRVTDNGTPPLSDSASFTLLVNELNNAPVLTVPPLQSLDELSTLLVAKVATDADWPADTLTFNLVSAPAGVSLDPATGLLSWTPTEAQGPSTNLITVRIDDNGQPALSETGTFTVVVNEVNSAPVLPAQLARTINELTLLRVTNTASDADLPANLLSYQLLSPPDGASIDSNGLISWTPSEEQGSTTNTFRTVVTDHGNPVLSATNSFTVVVNEVNSAPVLPLQTNQTINELTLLTVTNTASDTDLPAQLLTYELVSPPAGASIDSSGLIRWTPAEVQGPSTNTIRTIVTDNGSPASIVTNSFTVVVHEVNRAPVLTVPSYKVIHGLAALVVTNVATDPDLPANTLTFSLLSAPDGMSLDPASGVLSWTPTEAQLSSINFITVRVTDNGSPPLSDTAGFTVIVADSEMNNPPVLTPVADQSIDELSTLVLTNTAADPDIPANTVVFELLSSPAGMTLDSNTGVLSWTPTEAQGPSTNLITVKATDNGLPALSYTNAVTVVVNELNSAPVLIVPPNQTIAELSTLVVTNTAIDPDIPANSVAFSLLSPPEGMIIDSHTGVLSWTPTEAQGPSTNLITVKVTDDGAPALSSTHSFAVVVNEANRPPAFLQATPELRIDEQTLLVIDNPATDPDLPANTLTWSLLSAPPGMSINAALGFVQWTPIEAQGPGTNLVTIKVTDNGSPPLSASKDVRIIVNEVNRAPVLTRPPNQTINELTTLVLTNRATDADLPPNTLAFGLASGPAGVSVNPATGVLTWTPTEAQGPSTNTIAVKVTDNGIPALSHTNSFIVIVNEVNTAPVLASINSQVASAETQLIITNSASDSDIPANLLSYSLDSGSPAGAKINPINGVFTWTPGIDQLLSTNVVTVRVTDDGVPRLDDTMQFTILVVSTPVIEGIDASGNTITMTWSALEGITYRVQFKSDWSESTWIDLPGDITARGSTAMKTDVMDRDARYYRVLVLP